MLTLHFRDEAPDGQWPVVKLVQEFYKEIYPAHPDGVIADTLVRRPSSSYPRAILLRLFSSNQPLFLKSPVTNLLGLPP
ncbi:hypothetical protein PQX77_010691 [Marasmius sp. AFHP31]|nr:hypothetical protein PQX77_010691 [Marasmius sp. AFHP31]